MHAAPHYLDYVNLQQGTDSTWRFSRGNTLPLTQQPWAMAAFAPQCTGTETWWYSPHSRVVEGIRLTHQPSPWIGDYGAMMFTPQSRVFMDLFHETWTGMRPNDTVLRPDYLKLGFARSCATAELAPLKRGARVRMHFETDMSACVSFFNMMGNGHFQLDAAAHELRGWTDGYAHGQAKDFKMFVTVHPQGDWVDWTQSRTGCSGEKGAFAHLALKDSCRTAEFTLGISYIGCDFARRNVAADLTRSLEEIRAEAEALWEAHLGTVAIEAEEEEMKTFYSCMYRTGLFPHAAFEEDEAGNPVHYSPYLGGTRSGVRYIGHGFWDTYRTLLPMFSLTNKALYRDMVLSALGDYREGGWLPRWLAPGEVGCMPSTLIDSFLAQAATAGLVDRETLEEVLQAMLHHANNAAPETRFGRTGIREYVQMGYVPCDLYKQSVNLTQDFAFGDYCIAKVAEVLGYEDIAREYHRRASNYKVLLDAETRFMRPKDTAGKFKEPFDPLAWDEDYTESAAWQATFAVPHDLAGLAECMGGNDKLLEQLDALFAEKGMGRTGNRGYEIHEMTELNAEDFGQCAINNQPSFHIPFIYALFGQPEKTQYWVGRMCDEEFRAAPDGFPGDEDNGAMASWYVLSRLGMYPMCPADNTWVLIPSSVRGAFLGQPIEEFKAALKEARL
ncbi:MAG: GH92 family glycosyl hydrolase [Oscillospiraceae bacterium]|nr:GH92 family glycosyl hydrolase [Oscillospiraceae bacterium]